MKASVAGELGVRTEKGKGIRGYRDLVPTFEPLNLKAADASGPATTSNHAGVGGAVGPDVQLVINGLFGPRAGVGFGPSFEFDPFKKPWLKATLKFEATVGVDLGALFKRIPFVRDIPPFRATVFEKEFPLFQSGADPPLPPPPPVKMETDTLQAATSGVRYETKLSASGGSGRYLWHLDAAPPGIALSPDGVLAGTVPPGTVGSYPVRGTLRDADGDATVPFQVQLTVVSPAPPPLRVTSITLPDVDDTPYNTRLVAVGGVAPYSWAIESGSLPDGLTISDIGLISGRPTDPPPSGDYRFTVRVTDASGSFATRQVTIARASPPPVNVPALANELAGGFTTFRTLSISQNARFAAVCDTSSNQMARLDINHRTLKTTEAVCSYGIREDLYGVSNDGRFAIVEDGVFDLATARLTRLPQPLADIRFERWYRSGLENPYGLHMTPDGRFAVFFAGDYLIRLSIPDGHAVVARSNQIFNALSEAGGYVVGNPLARGDDGSVLIGFHSGKITELATSCTVAPVTIQWDDAQGDEFPGFGIPVAPFVVTPALGSNATSQPDHLCTFDGDYYGMLPAAFDISPNGRFVAAVVAVGLVPEDIDGEGDLYLFDRLTGSVRLINTISENAFRHDYDNQWYADQINSVADDGSVINVSPASGKSTYRVVVKDGSFRKVANDIQGVVGSADGRILLRLE